MSGRFAHFETQMMELDDQNRIIDSQKGIREEIAKEEHLLFAKARDAATAPAPTVQIAKVPPKPRPKLPSFVQTAAVGKRPKFDLSILAPGADASFEAADCGTRRVYVDGAWHEARIWDRPALPVGAVVPGPAVLEQSDATIFVEPDLQARVDAFGNLLVNRKEAS